MRRRANPARRATLQAAILPGVVDQPPIDRPVRVLSYGGGVDSFCMLLAAIDRGEIPDRMVFMDVGDPARRFPAEWPETYDHIIDVAAPVAAEYGIPFHWIMADYPTGELARRLKDARVIVDTYKIRPPKRGKGKIADAGYSEGVDGLFEFMVVMGMVPTKANRICTEVAKIERFDKWLADTFPGRQVEVWIGFEKGEEHRLGGGKTYSISGTGAGDVTRIPRFPLMEEDLTRQGCKERIERWGLMVPMKSACVFCPFGKKEEWVDFFLRYPEVFAQVEDMWARKPPTAAGYKLGQVFATYELTPAQFQLLRSIDSSKGMPRDLTPGRQRTTWDSLRAKQWITERGKVSRYGKPILREALALEAELGEYPTKGVYPIEGDDGEVRQTKAATARGLVVRRAHGGKPVVGVHYDTQTLGDWVQGLIRDRKCDVDVDVEKVRQAAQVVRASRKVNPPWVWPGSYVVVRVD